VLLNHRGIVQW